MFFYTKLVTLASVIVVASSTSTHFVKQSIVMIRNLSCFFPKGNGSIMSIPHWVEGHGEDMGVIVFLGLVWTFAKR